MKKLMQHKSFIYHGDNLSSNREVILNDLSELLEVPVESLFNSEDVWQFNSSDLVVDDWEEVYNHFLYNPHGHFKVIFFDNADKLSSLFQNKLLKPIEDCKENVRVIFNTTRDLLPTIISRSMKVTVVSNILNQYPKNSDDLMKYFEVKEQELVIVTDAILGLSKAIRNSSSLLVGSGLIKEKNKALAFLKEKVQEIARLVILSEIESGVVTNKSLIARRYLEIEPSENNLYLLMFEMEN